MTNIKSLKRFNLGTSDEEVLERLESLFRSVIINKNVGEALVLMYERAEVVPAEVVWDLLENLINFLALYHTTDHVAADFRNPKKIIGESINKNLSNNNPNSNSWLGNVEVDSKTYSFPGGMYFADEEMKSALFNLQLRIKAIRPKVSYSSTGRANFVLVQTCKNPEEILISPNDPCTLRAQGTVKRLVEFADNAANKRRKAELRAQEALKEKKRLKHKINQKQGQLRRLRRKAGLRSHGSRHRRSSTKSK